jgi:transcription initiation factor TFIID TATA-box-binding protein
MRPLGFVASSLAVTQGRADFVMTRPAESNQSQLSKERFQKVSFGDTGWSEHSKRHIKTYLNPHINTPAGDPVAKIKIENVVASTSLGEELDLPSIALALEGAEYEPKQFPGLIYRLKEPKTATLLFRSGKVVCTGAKSLENVKLAITKVAKLIEKAGVKIKVEPKIEVQNIVASSDLEQEINLNAIAISLGLERVEYEPEQFPGLVYRIDKPKVVVLLFGSGKLVCTGARKPQDVEDAVNKITEELKAAGLLR